VNQFFDAVENGDTHLVSTFLEADPSLVNATDTRMTKPIGYRIKMRVKREGSPKPQLRPRERASMNTALHIAASNRHFEIARMLLQRGANVNAVGDRGTPLQTALDMLNGPVSLELVALLIESDADVNAGGPGRATALHLAIEAMQYIPPPPKALVEILLRAGADAAARTSCGVTPLQSLLEIRKCIERDSIVKMLIQAEALSARPTEAALLCLAASKDEPEVLRVLLEAGIDPDRADDAGSPLHHAARHGFSENVSLLLSAGADPRALDQAGRTAIDCIPHKLLEALNILEQHVSRSGL